MELAAITGMQPGLQVVGPVPDGKRAIRLHRGLLPDVVWMDLELPDLGGWQAGEGF